MNIRCIHVGHHRPRRPWHIQSHAHPHFQLVGVLDGMEHVRLADGRRELSAGEIILFGPDVAHEEWSDPGHPLETCFLDFAWDPLPASWPLVVSDANGRIRVLMEWLLEEHRTPSRQAEEIRQALLQSIVQFFLKSAAPEEDALVTATRAHIRAHLAAPLSLGTLAAQAGLSKYHFLRRYKRLTGRTPMQDVRDLRLEAARNLILTTNLPLKAVAPEVGLGDEYHLSRLFRRCLNATPGALRGRRG